MSLHFITEFGNITDGKKVVNSDEFIFTTIRCAAEHLAPLVTQAFNTQQFESVAYFEPDYLKPPNITTPKKIL